jgi:hypothetical protein
LGAKVRISEQNTKSIWVFSNGSTFDKVKGNEKMVSSDWVSGNNYFVKKVKQQQKAQRSKLKAQRFSYFCIQN